MRFGNSNPDLMNGFQALVVGTAETDSCMRFMDRAFENETIFTGAMKQDSQYCIRNWIAG